MLHQAKATSLPMEERQVTPAREAMVAVVLLPVELEELVVPVVALTEAHRVARTSVDFWDTVREWLPVPTPLASPSQAVNKQEAQEAPVVTVGRESEPTLVAQVA